MITTEMTDAPKIVALAELPRSARIVLVGAFLQVVVGIFALGPALPMIQAAVGHAGDTIISAPLVGSVAGFTFALMSILGGGLTEQVGYRRMLILSLIITNTAGLAGTVWANMPFILLTRGVVGASVALSINASLFAVGTVLVERDRRRTLSLMAIVGSASGLVLSPLVGLLSATNWRLAFFPHVLAAFAIPMAFSLPGVPPRAKKIVTVAKARRLDASLMSAAALAGTVNFIVGVFGSSYLVGLGVTNPLVLSLPAMIGAGGSMLGASASVLLNRRVSRDVCVVISLCCFAVGLGGAAVTSQVPLFLAGGISAAFGVGLLVPSVNASAILKSPQNPGPALGMVTGVLYGSMVLFPLIAVPFAQSMGGIAHAILATAVLSLLAAVPFGMRLHHSSPPLKA